MTRSPQNRVLSMNWKIRQKTWTNGQAWTYKINTKQIRKNPRLLWSPRGQAPWRRKILDFCCICLGFIVYVQAWLFGHGFFLIFFNSLNKNYCGEDGLYMNICFFVEPIHLFIGFAFETSVLINVSSIYIYRYIYIYYIKPHMYIGRTVRRTADGRQANGGRRMDGGRTA